MKDIMKKWIIVVVLTVLLGWSGLFLLNLFAPRPLLELIALPFYPILSRTAWESLIGGLLVVPAPLVQAALE